MLVVPAFGATYRANSADSLQRFIDLAQRGDTIELQAGATFTGNFVLRAKTAGAGVITIQSSQASLLPARVSPADRIRMARIVTAKYLPAFATESRARGYVLRGLEITVSPKNYTWSLVALGNDERLASDLPEDIAVRQCYLHGDPAAGTKNGLILNAARVTVTGNYVSDIKSDWQDSHAIISFNGTGGFLIENNHLEASGENIMFGGGTASIPGLVPSDIVVRNNVLFKPLSWREGTAGYEGRRWIVKNHLEVKNGQRILIESNVMENCWAQGQMGASILLTVSTEDGEMPWAVVQDIQIVNNVIRHAGIGILTHTRSPFGGAGRRWTICNNTFEDIDAAHGANLGGTVLVLTGNTPDVRFEHNTAFASKYSLYFGESPTPGLIFADNIVSGAFCGDSLGCNSTLEQYVKPAIRGNIFVGDLVKDLPSPARNQWIAAIENLGVVSLAPPNYRLSAASRFAGSAADGFDPGSSITAERAFVDFVYYNLLGRLPSATDAAGQARALETGQMNRASLVRAVVTSPEFAAISKFTAGLYYGLFDRDADIQGWLHQRRALLNGQVTAPGLVANCLASEEFRLAYGSLDDRGFVSKLYRDIMRRTPTEQEIDFQVKALAAGTVTRVSMAYAFLTSAEFRSAAERRVTVFLTYATLLRRQVEPAEAAQWTQVSEAALLDSLIAQLLNTSEFRTQFWNSDDNALLRPW